MKFFLAAVFFYLSAALQSADKFEHSMYLRLGLGGRLFSGADINRQFYSPAPGSTQPLAPDQWAFNSDISLGYQGPSLFGIELGLNGGQGLQGLLSSLSSRSISSYNYSISYGDIKTSVRAGAPGSVRTISQSISLTTFYIMPALRLPSPGLFNRNFFHTLGFQLGTSALNGWNDYAYSGSSYYYNTFHAQSLTYGFCYRIEQMLGKRMSLGLDAGYTWASYSPTFTSGGSVPRSDGSPLTLDFSGPSIKLSLGLWILRPFINPAEDKALAEARAARAKLKRSRRRRGSVDVNAEMAQRLLAKGDVLMDQQNYPLAVELYREAATTDPDSRWAWQGLGNAQFYLGKKDEALAAYERAFLLSPGDEKLVALIEKLRSEKMPLP